MLSVDPETLYNLPYMLTKTQCADYLGVCRQTLERYIAEQELPCVRLGGQDGRGLRIPATELLEWLERRRVKAG